MARANDYVAFPPRKLSRSTVRDYVRRASDGPIRSSIPELVGQAADEAGKSATAAQKAQVETQNVRTVFRNVSVAAVAALIVALAALYISVGGYISDARNEDVQFQRQVDELRSKLSEKTPNPDPAPSSSGPGDRGR
jgi:cytochrome c-type biogenesis protein CcmH/NrfG